MKSRSFVIIVILTVAIALAWLTPMTAGQAPTPSSNTWTPRRLADGQPDVVLRDERVIQAYLGERYARRLRGG